MWGGGRGSKIVMISSSFFFLILPSSFFFFFPCLFLFNDGMVWRKSNLLNHWLHFVWLQKDFFFCLMLFFVFPYSELTQISLEGSIPFYHHITCVYISLAMDFYRGGNKLQKNIILQSPKNKKNMFFIQSKSTCLRS